MTLPVHSQKVMQRSRAAGGKWGYIDKTGAEVVPQSYDDAKPFTQGLAAVSTENKWGFVNNQGKLVIAARFDQAWPFKDSMAEVRAAEGKVGFIDKMA